MNTNEDRFTAEQIMEVERRTRNAAHYHEYSGTVQQAKRYRETASILRQAASDTARIAELTAEVARYKADAERLEWCEVNHDHSSMPYYEDGKFNVTWLSRQAEGVCTSQFNTLREAIDFARNALKDGV